MNEAVILLDTIVVSELMRPMPAQAAATLPASKSRDSLTSTIDIMIAEDFADSVLPFAAPR